MLQYLTSKRFTVKCFHLLLTCSRSSFPTVLRETVFPEVSECMKTECFRYEAALFMQEASRVLAEKGDQKFSLKLLDDTEGVGSKFLHYCCIAMK